MTIEVQRCEGCGRNAFPPHLLCAACGGDRWSALPVSDGVLERVTVVRRSLGGAPADPPTVGRVRIEGAIRVIARVEGGAAPGDRVQLDMHDGAVVARAT